MANPEIHPEGWKLFPGLISRTGQEELVDIIRQTVEKAPFFRPVMPKTAKHFSVRMTNFGDVGWVSDQKGYRYQKTHPATDLPWPPIPQPLLDIWQAVTQANEKRPDACLVNFYDANAKMGLHRDEDEQDLTAPVVSISLGDDARFRLGGPNRTDKTGSFRLPSGDVLILQGRDRLAYHGVDRIYAGSSTLLEKGGRINITMRRAL